MKDLIKEYGETLDNLNIRREEIEKLIPTVRGEEYFKAIKRYSLIKHEIVEMELKIKHMHRSMEKGVRF